MKKLVIKRLLTTGTKWKGGTNVPYLFNMSAQS
jgi:hypothetical protein